MLQQVRAFVDWKRESFLMHEWASNALGVGPAQPDPVIDEAVPVQNVQHVRSASRLHSGHLNQLRRLGVFAQCDDGFVLAEEDLKIRGPGHVLGVKQWGEITFRVADLARDVSLLTKARQVAGELLHRDPDLSFPENQFLKETLLRKWGEKLALGSIG